MSESQDDTCMRCGTRTWAGGLVRGLCHWCMGQSCHYLCQRKKVQEMLAKADKEGRYVR